jgi:hypothetical protein
MVMLLALTGCAEEAPAQPQDTEMVGFRIALRSQFRQPGDAIGSGDYEVVNEHRFPITPGGPGHVVSVSDGVVLEAHWEDAEVRKDGNPEKEFLVLSGFTWQVHNGLVHYNATHTYKVLDPEDVALSSTWYDLIAPIAADPGGDDPRALSLQFRWEPHGDLSAEPFDVIEAAGEPELAAPGAGEGDGA